MEDTDQKPKAKKSENRQRQKQVKLRFTDDEFNRAAAKAEHSGLSLAAYFRAAGLGDAGPRAKPRLPLDAELLRNLHVQITKCGTNMNQIAKVFNTAGRPVPSGLSAAITEYQHISDALFSALGKTPPRRSRP